MVQIAQDKTAALMLALLARLHVQLFGLTRTQEVMSSYGKDLSEVLGKEEKNADQDE